MKTTLIVTAVGLFAVGVTGAFAMTGIFSAKQAPDRVEAVGSFEIVIRTTRQRTGWNEGRLGWTNMEWYSLRHRGKPLTIEGKAGMFGQDTLVYDTMNMIVTFSGKEPVLIVNVGDPNNSSFYYLVREKNGEPLVEYICDDSGGISWAGWLDPAPPAAGGRRDVSGYRIHLEGGRYLLLGDWCVFDTETLEAHPFSGSRRGSINNFKVPLGMSPDRTSFVRLGWDPDNAPVMLVFDFIDQTSYAVSIDRAIQRFSTFDQIDDDWVAYYFEWVRSEGHAHDRFVPRSVVTPRPWKGVLSIDEGGYREYRIEPVREELRSIIIEFFRKEMGAELLPRAQYSDVDPVKFGDRIVKVSFYDTHVGLWMERSEDSRFVEELGNRVDELLASGELDQYFVK